MRVYSAHQGVEDDDIDPSLVSSHPDSATPARGSLDDVLDAHERSVAPLPIKLRTLGAGLPEYAEAPVSDLAAIAACWKLERTKADQGYGEPCSAVRARPGCERSQL